MIRTGNWKINNPPITVSSPRFEKERCILDLAKG
jgi:hypothetical protein